MNHLNTYVAVLALGLCCFFCCTDAANVNNSDYLYRLPTSIKPESYELKVITHLENPLYSTFDGKVSILFNVLQNTTNITLHSQNLTIDEARIKLISYNGQQVYDVLKVTQVPELDFFIIQVNETLRQGQTLKLDLVFSGVFNDKLHGYYRSSYVVKATNETRWLSVTSFEPALARAAFPCFDEPVYKAKFVIWLGHHKNLRAISNMPLEKQAPLEKINDFVWSIFEQSVPMSTYLVAYSVNDFAYKKSEPNSESNNKITFRTWARPEAVDQCTYASEVGPRILKYYEDIFGIPFPLRKIDQIAIPDFSAGAMKNWGLVTYLETALLFAPNVSSNFDKLRIVQVMALELAHQWFGNLVTMKWWSDLWLNEVFAAYVASLGVQHLSPEFELYNKNSLENTLIIFRRDAQLSSHPISQPIVNTSQIAERFDWIAYRKGSAVLRMLHLFLEDDVFFGSVTDYLNKHKYANAEQDDLWAALTDKAHQYNRIPKEYEIKSIMDSWTLQTGYPLVRVMRDYETGSVTFSQHRFLENKTLTEHQTDKEQCWWVPLSYTTASKMNFQTTTPQNWLECDESGKSKKLRLDNLANRTEWVIVNIQLSGVFRVMYDTENSRLLNETLNSNNFTRIHIMNRAQLIDDSLWLAWSGYHDYDITFDILEYLIREREYLPWKTTLEGLRSVNRLLKSFQSYYELFKRNMRYIIKPVYFYLSGVNATDFEGSQSFTKILHKSVIAEWACGMEMDDCVQNSLKYFKQWKTSKNPSTENNIPVDLRPTVYCTSIHHGSEEDWQFLWQRYNESNVATEKRTIIYSLACSRNTEILSNYLKMTFDKTDYIRKQDALYAFGSVAINEVGFPIAKQYFMKNIDKLNKFYGPYSDDLGYSFFYLASQVVTPEDLNRLRSLFESKREYFKSSEMVVQYALETINFNLQWIDQNVRDTNSRLLSRLRSVN